MKLSIVISYAIYTMGAIGVLMMIYGMWGLVNAGVGWLRERRREPTTHGDDGGRPIDDPACEYARVNRALSGRRAAEMDPGG